MAPEHHGHVVARRAQPARRIMRRGSEISIRSDVLEAVGDGDV